MPIVDIEIVREPSVGGGAPSARALADALGKAFGCPSGQVWVRVHCLDVGSYAENGVDLTVEALPVFVTVLHAHPPAGPLLAAELLAVTQAVAHCLARSPEYVHVQYAPQSAGRQAFGGRLVD